MIKTCSKCKQELDISAFSSEKVTYCRVCMKEYDDTRKEKKKEYWKNYAKTTDVLQRKKEYYQKNRESELQRQKTPHAIALRKAYLERNKEKIVQRSRNYYYTVGKAKDAERHKKYREEHGDELRARQRLWYAQNKDRIAKQNKEPYKCLNKALSIGIYMSLKDAKANRHWEDLVPYTLQELKEHLEKQFTPEMSWDNKNEYWEIDHIIPKNQFKFSSADDKDFKICWSLANLRPLEKIANRSRPKDGSDVSEELKQKILSQEF